MKKLITQKGILFFLITICFSMLWQSCTDKCEETYTYTTSEPVYLTFDELRQPVAAASARNLENPGKIFFRSPYLFVNEVAEGVHIIDNTDVSNPKNVGFIEIPGNVDIAVKGNILYADNYVDLLAINIGDPLNPQLINRVEDVFSENFSINPEEGIITHFEDVEHVETYPCDGEAPVPQNNGWYYPFFGGPDIDFTNDAESLGGGGNLAPGIAGSMARFALYQNQLYVVTRWDIHVYNITAPDNPIQSNIVPVSWDVETIFPFEDHLLIGSESGMFIYSVENPESPYFVSEFAHVRSCDPVVAEGDYAYVTLRSGTFCEGFSNQLDVLDISNFSEPELVATYPLTNPHGLGIDNGTLFICDGSDGLKIYDASNPETIGENLIQHYPNIETFDVIPFNNIAFMIGSNGLFQYDYTDLDNIILLSTIPVIDSE